MACGIEQALHRERKMKNSLVKSSSCPFFTFKGNEWPFSIFKEWNFLQVAKSQQESTTSLLSED